MNLQDASSTSAVRNPRMKSPDRSQIDPNPKRIDDLIPPSHKARLVWELVRDLDLTPLYGRIKAVEGHAGRPPIDPRILVALWLYGTDESIASARELKNIGFIRPSITGNAYCIDAKIAEVFSRKPGRRFSKGCGHRSVRSSTSSRCVPKVLD